MYAELLAKAVRALKNGELDGPLEEEHETEVELGGSALFPEDYIGDVNARLTLYKRLGQCGHNDDVDDLQTAIAFARGASKQYGCKWGIDLSLWWGVIHGCVQNLEPSFHRRNLFISYFSGTQAYRIEGGGLSLNPGTTTPNKLGEAFDKFFTFASQTHPGQIETPVAIVLPEDNGWITPPYWRTNNEAWNYARIPYRPGDRGIDGFFGAAFPGSVYAMDPFPAGCYGQDNPPASRR